VENYIIAGLLALGPSVRRFGDVEAGGCVTKIERGRQL